MVESVTTIGCMRSSATNTPLNAPEAMPIAMPTTVSSNGEVSAAGKPVASVTLTSDTTAPAERSKPPDSTTSVWPAAAIASVAPDAAICDRS